MAHIYPLQLVVASLAGWVNRHQAEVLEYLVEENRVLKEQLRGRPLRLNDDQRRRLAAKGKRIGRRMLMRVATIVTPDTILRWHRKRRHPKVDGQGRKLDLHALRRKHSVGTPRRRSRPPATLAEL